MKKLLLVILVAILTVGSGYAQRERRDPAARLQKEIENLTTELSLSKEQVAQVTPILSESQKKMAEAVAKIRESGGGNFDREKMRDEGMKIRFETDKQLKAVLTPEQVIKLKAYRKKQMEERAKREQQQ